VGGAFRSLRAVDGWLGLSLARDSDRELIPALVEQPVVDDPWRAVETWLHERSILEAVDRARLLGLPAGVVATSPAPMGHRAVGVTLGAAKPRALRGLGIDAADHVANGRIWIAITAYGRDHPERVGFGDDVAAAAGLVDDDGDRPYPVGDAIADPLAGVTAAAAAAAALRAQRGCLLDVSMYDVTAAAARLPGAAIAVVHRADGWWVEVGETTVPVRPPRARVPHARAPGLGAHTTAVLDSVRRTSAFS
jgi:hypothetical protein